MIELKPRTFVLPAIALTVLAMLHAPADGGRAAQGGCAVRALDPGIRASFVRFTGSQSQTVDKVCALAGNAVR
jgi:hypothetical protein